ncbi:regulator of G-protein signaling 2-like [Protopterus annectens]|uniref:regulator of G-protein signaling 2-like n=1 Tax=Protopterus annectens TaxID=7888 RepID=UPI001CFA41EC|nr:regulator of G-protein signaling 2-like [Protopterus annectens]
MQSAVILRVSPGPAHTDRTGHICQETVDKPTRRRRAYLKDLKSRLNYLLQNSNAPSDPASKQHNKKNNTPLSRPSPSEARSWSESFDALLTNKYARTAFRAFLKSEFCEENMDFWLACEDFKQTKSSSKMLSKAKKIYDEFVGPEALREINIDSNTREMITDSLQAPTPSCFDAAQKRVYGLMMNNTYPRFIQSEFYQNLCKTTEETQEDAQWNR